MFTLPMSPFIRGKTSSSTSPPFAACRSYMPAREVRQYGDFHSRLDSRNATSRKLHEALFDARKYTIRGDEVAHLSAKLPFVTGGSTMRANGFPQGGVRKLEEKA